MTQEPARAMSPSFKLVWKNVARSNPYDRIHILMFVLYPILSTVLYEGAQYGLDNPRLHIATATSTLVMLAAYLILMFPFYKFPKLRKSALGKSAVVVSVYLIKSATAVVIIAGPDLEALGLWLKRAPGDATIVLIAWIALAAATTANNDYRAAVRELEKNERELAIQEGKRLKAAHELDRRLRKLAQAALVKELQQIENSLKGVAAAKDGWRVSAEIANLIDSKIRPFSKELLSRIDLLSHLTEQEGTYQKKRVRSLRFSLSQDSRFMMAYLAATLNVVVTVFQHSSFFAALLTAVVSISYLLIGCSTRLIWPKKSRLRLFPAVTAIGLISTLAYIPTFLTIRFLSQAFQELEIIQFTAYFVYLFMAIGFSIWAANQRGRDEYLTQAQLSQKSIQHELALIDQEIWHAKRNWAYKIHGTVQGTLSVASSRLVMNDELSPELIKRVQREIELAKSALIQPAEFDKSISEICKDIKQTWLGVLDVDFNLQPEAMAVLGENAAAKGSLNEIVKELASNARRHGKAGELHVSASLREDGDLELLAKNNGLPIGKNFSSGMGNSMFDELSLSWEILNFQSPTFRFVIPLKQSSKHVVGTDE